MPYHYLGGGMAFFERFMEPDVTRSYGPSNFSRLDRFGRIVHDKWHDNDAATTRVEITYGHDRAGNRLHKENQLAASQSELYDYDALHRLIDIQRGELNGTQDAIVTNELAFQQNWTLSMLGNWRSFDEDDDGDATWDLEQTRTHSEANEIDGIDETTGPAWATPGHDANGNMTSLPQPASPTSSYTATYDAWNRLVKLEDDGTSNTVAAYEYDGLNRRIVKKVYASGSLDETRHVYYSRRWQVLEVRMDGTADTDVQVQYVWGLQYVDELILRDRDTTGNGTLNERLYVLQDANFNVTAIVDDTGTVQERYRYAPYGQRTVLNDDFTEHSNLTTGSFAFAIGHQGLPHDHESGLVYNRNRMLHTGLGRFMQRDPLGQNAPRGGYHNGMNLYQYQESNSVARVDPSGLDFIALASRPLKGPAGWPTAFKVNHYSVERWISDCPGPNQAMSIDDYLETYPHANAWRVGAVEVLGMTDYKYYSTNAGGAPVIRDFGTVLDGGVTFHGIAVVSFTSEATAFISVSDSFPGHTQRDRLRVRDEWYTIYNNASKYEYAEQYGERKNLSNWPKSYYEAWGTNSNVFALNMLREAGLPLASLPGWHPPGYAVPSQNAFVVPIYGTPWHESHSSPSIPDDLLP